MLCIEGEKMSDFHEAQAGWLRSKGEEEGRQAREEERREQEGEERGYDSE